jgi:arabinose-5-phosphate isomerase
MGNCLNGVFVKFDLDYAKSVIEDEASAIKSMVDVIDDSFAKTVELIYNTSGSVIITGIGKAGIIGEKISSTFASTGTPSHFLHPAEAVHGDLGRVQSNDIIVAMSHSGESEEIIRLIDPIKQRKIKLIAITGNKDSRLGMHSDIVLCMGIQTEACPLGAAPSVSTTCMLALGDAIAFTVMKARNFGTEDYARFHPGGELGRRLITVGQSMMFKDDEELPLVSQNDTIREMIKKTDRLKRRGAVMVVDSKGELTGIITDADLRRTIAKDIDGFLNKKTSEIMTPDCKRVTKDTLAAEAMAVFHEYRIDELPVVDNKNRPIGLIDVQDIVTIKIVD